MENTYLDYFNYYLKEFCNEIVNNFPEAKANVLANYRLLLEGRDNKSDIYCKYFLNNVNAHIDDICAKNESMFTSGDDTLNFLVGVDFRQLWASEMNNERTKHSLWKYLQLLSHLSRNVVPELEEISDLLSRVGGEIEAPTKMLRTFENEDALAESGTGEQTSFDMLNAVSMVTNLFNNGGTTFDNIKGLLSGVLSGLGLEGIEETLEKFNVSEIIADLGLDGKELNMETIQEIMGDPEKMKTALNKLTENLDTCGEGEGGGMFGQVLMMMKQMMSMFNMPMNGQTADEEDVVATEGEDGKCENTNNTDNGNNEADNTEAHSNDADNTAPLGDMFSNMMKSMMNNDAINKMAADMEAGKQFNPMDMLSNLMGNTDIMNMAKTMAKQNPSMAQQAQRARGRNRETITRDRLRAKIAAKKAAEANK